MVLLHSPQLTINKVGVIKFGPDLSSRADLDIIQLLMAEEVCALQEQFPHTSIWLVHETLHAWYNGKTISVHWTDADSLKEILHAH